MLTEQQLAILRSAPSTNRVAKAISVAGVTQVTVADAVGLPQPYVSDVARQRYRTITVENARKFADYSLAPSRICSRHPVDNLDRTRTDLRSKLLADTLLGTDMAFDLIGEIAALSRVQWSHAPGIGLRGSVGAPAAPTVERIRAADPETDEPFASPVDGRSLRLSVCSRRRKADQLGSTNPSTRRNRGERDHAADSPAMSTRVGAARSAARRRAGQGRDAHGTAARGQWDAARVHCRRT